MDLLIELFSEEIPARMQPKAREDLRRLMTDGLVEAGLTYRSAGAFSTPRRLALAVEGLDAQSMLPRAISGRVAFVPGTAFYAPDAAERCVNNPMGYQWFPIPWLDGSTEDQARASMNRSIETGTGASGVRGRSTTGSAKDTSARSSTPSSSQSVQSACGKALTSWRSASSKLNGGK